MVQIKSGAPSCEPFIEESDGGFVFTVYVRVD